ncbi:hypothetical protein D3C71_1726730 [compost metagenome]
MKLQLPSASTGAVPASLPSMYTDTVMPACAVPLTVGRASSVMPSFWMLPVTEPTSSITLVIAGGFGLSALPRVRSNASDGTLVLPAASTASTVSLWSPRPSGSFGSNVHLPSAPTSASPIFLPLS